MQTKILDPNCEKTYALAASLLAQGGLVAFPTETVYGLGASIWNEEAVRSIFRVKGRPFDNPLIAHLYDFSQVEEIVHCIPSIFWILAHAFFPGPLTIVLEKKQHISSIATAGLQTIAFRMPAHPVAQNLLKMVKIPILAPSANLSGKPSPVTAEHVWEDLEGKIPLILDGGRVPLGIESTVISLFDPENPLLLRPGTITQEAIEDVIKKSLKKPALSSKPISPGMKYRHYAPNAKIVTFKTIDELNHHLTLHPKLPRIVLSNDELGDLHFNASCLYAAFRLADQKKCQEICIYLDPKSLQDVALMNRLNHASCQ